MSYQIYRTCALGGALMETLDEWVQTDQMSSDLAISILEIYDKTVKETIAKKCGKRISLKGTYEAYRIVDRVCTLVLNDVELRDCEDCVTLDRIKLVACPTPLDINDFMKQNSTDKHGKENCKICLVDE